MKTYFILKQRLFLIYFLIIGNFVFSQSDDPCGAPSLTVSTSCTFSTYTNATATASEVADPSIPAPGCASYSGGDVWFTVTVPASGNVTVDMNTGIITDAGMAIYSGTCGSLSLIECDDDDSPNGLMSMISLTGQTAGSTLWIRVWEYGNNNNGTFDICATLPPAPASNDECATATALTVNPDFSCGTVTPGTVTGVTASSQANGCSGTADDDVWYSFVATNTSHTVSLQNISGSVTDMYHSVYSGTCGSIGTALICSDPNSSTVTGLTIGNTYYVRVYTYTATGGQTTTFDVCIGTPPPPPANDECTGAIALTVNPDNLCGTVTSGTIASATTSSQANGCSGTADDDVWYSFVATGPTHMVTLQNIVGSTTDLYHSVYGGSCGSPGTALVCSDPNSSTINGLTIGNTYFVRIYSWTSTAGQTTTFDVCIGTPPPPPANDECTGAIAVTVSPSGGACSPTTGSVASATASSQANGCSGTADDDVWYSFVATSTAVQVSISNISGSTSDLYHSVYAGACGSPGTALVCSDPNSSSITGLTIGNTYFVRIYTWTGTAGQTTVFDLCIEEVGPCGTPSNQDYCNSPAFLTSGTGSFSSNTSGTYTADTPANLSIFCGSIENNSWYQFTASTTTETFNFTSVTGCTSGIQAEVYDVATDANGCCTNFTSMSNCWNPSTATTGTVTATGLTVGNTYMLMVDGFGGDVCDFTVSNWTGIGILPVTFGKLDGLAMTNKNNLHWSTITETNNHHFNILRSLDGISFEKIGEKAGAGSSVKEINYQFEDRDIQQEIMYYQIEQIDFDGESTKSEVIAISRKGVVKDILLSPNPVREHLFIQTSEHTSAIIEIQNMNGRIVLTKEISNANSIVINTNHLQKGIYFVRMTDDNNKTIIKKFIKI